ncbi:MAG: hypothetical protein IPF92_27460 [Myxococcales bacterium]|nr:hypothetical protein [Myxococcales bacterium]
MAVEELVFDDDALADAMRVATPEARRVVDQLTCGATAKDLVIGGLVDAAWLDELMVDQYARGRGARAIYGTSRSELLEPAIAARLAGVSRRRPPGAAHPRRRALRGVADRCGDSEASTSPSIASASARASAHARSESPSPSSAR